MGIVLSLILDAVTIIGYYAVNAFDDFVWFCAREGFLVINGEAGAGMRTGDAIISHIVTWCVRIITKIFGRDEHGIDHCANYEWAIQNPYEPLTQLFCNVSFAKYGFESSAEAATLYEHIITSRPNPAFRPIPLLSEYLSRRDGYGPYGDLSSVPVGPVSVMTLDTPFGSPVRALVQRHPDAAQLSTSASWSFFRRATIPSNQQLRGDEPVIMFGSEGRPNTTDPLDAIEIAEKQQKDISDALEQSLKLLSHYATALMPGVVEQVGAQAFRDKLGEVATQMGFEALAQSIGNGGGSALGKRNWLDGEEDIDVWQRRFVAFRERMYAEFPQVKR